MQRLLYIMIVLCLISLLGCCPKVACPSAPLCQHPSKPELAQGGENLLENFAKVAGYSKELEAALECYSFAYGKEKK